jgi:hypothetical protein
MQDRHRAAYRPDSGGGQSDSFPYLTAIDSVFPMRLDSRTGNWAAYIPASCLRTLVDCKSAWYVATRIWRNRELAARWAIIASDVAQGNVQAVFQCRGVEWLCKKADCTGGHRSLAYRFLRKCGHEDDGNHVT